MAQFQNEDTLGEEAYLEAPLGSQNVEGRCHSGFETLALVSTRGRPLPAGSSPFAFGPSAALGCQCCLSLLDL
jgi:hypothetical protein